MQMRLSVSDFNGPGPVTERLCLVLLIPTNARTGEGPDSKYRKRQKMTAASRGKIRMPGTNLEFPICITFGNLKDLHPRVIGVADVEQTSVVDE